MNFFKNDWDFLLDEEMNKKYFRDLIEFIKIEYSTKTIYPPRKDIFKVFKITACKDVKVVILGQDPYHTPNTAMGLSFSVNTGCNLPPSLQNIYKELESDLNIKPANHGNLLKWSKQGVFLLNSTLTVEKSKPNSHSNIGWATFTDKVISILNDREDPVAFILWGAFANQKIKLITNHRHLVVSSSHPSPFSANKGFFGSKPFSKVNNFLKEKSINWNLN